MTNEQKRAWLCKIDAVNSSGEYKPDWESLSKYPVAKWYTQAKFGVFIHWGVFTVPEYYNEWYPRFMYYKGTQVYRHHIKKYGKDFNYRDFIPMFKAEKFDAKSLVGSVKECGAKFVMPVAEHHDGIKLYNSELSDWTTVKLPVGRDFLREMKEECEKQDLIFSTSSHRAEHFWFLNGGRTLGYPNETTDEKYRELYGECKNICNKNNLKALMKQEHGIEPTTEWLEDWLVSSCELVEKYKPSSLFFDWWTSYRAFRPYMKRFLAYYYNRSVDWGKEVCVYYKSDAIMYNCAVFDRERGQLENASPYVWQSETSTAYNSWCYCTTNRFKSPETIICNFLDVISKNGCFVLNIGPKADGSICDEEKHILETIGSWTKKNSEAIWGTKPYKVIGEGKKQKGGSFNERLSYSSNDYRFLCRPGAVYAFALKPKGKKEFCIKSFKDTMDLFHCIIKRVSILGEDDNETLDYRQDKNGLRISLGKKAESELPLCFKVEID